MVFQRKGVSSLRAGLFAAVLVGAAVAAVPASPASAVVLCNGVPATVVGTPGGDTIIS